MSELSEERRWHNAQIEEMRKRLKNDICPDTIFEVLDFLLEKAKVPE